MAVLVVAQLMDLMDAMITNVALPSIRDDLGASQPQLEWTLTGYVLAFAVGLVTGGRLGDRIGRRRVFVGGVAAFTLASALAAFAPDGGTLVVARVLQGASAALMVPQVLSTAQALYQPHERGKVFALLSALGGVGVLAGQLLGGWLVSADVLGLGWRTIFLVNLPVGVTVLVAALLLVPETRSSDRLRLDLPGVAMVTTTVFLVVYPISVGGSYGWPGWVWALLVLAPLVAAGFVATQSRAARSGRAAVVPLELFRDRGFAAGCLVQLAYQVGWGSFALMIGLYVQESLGFSAWQAGLTMLPVTLGSFLGSAAGPFAERLGRRAVVAGGLMQAAAFVGYAAVIERTGAAMTVHSLVIPLAVAGIGMIVLAVPLMGTSLARVPLESAGAASGVFAMCQQLGSAVGIAVVGVVFFGIVGQGGPNEVYRHAIVSGTWITVGAFVVAALAGLSLPRREVELPAATRDAVEVAA